MVCFKVNTQPTLFLTFHHASWSWYWVLLKEFHTSLFLVSSTFKNIYIDPSIEFKNDFWLVCGKYTLGIETGL
jgi:hypothetical protein